MDRKRNKESGSSRQGGQARRRKRKVCLFCAKKVVLDYKDLSQMRKYVSDRGKILPGRITGCCALHQRAVATAVRRAREIGLIPFSLD